MSDQDDEPRAIPTDEEQLRRLAVADLLGVQGPVVFRESTAYFRLHLRRGHDDDTYPNFWGRCSRSCSDASAVLAGLE